MEFAAQQGTLIFMMAILNTREVYLVDERLHDVTIYRKYDVTEYESVNSTRYYNSPLKLLPTLDSRHALTAMTYFRSGPLRDWLDNSVKTRMWFKMADFLAMLLRLVLLLIWEEDVSWIENASELDYCRQFSQIKFSRTSKAVIGILLIVLSAIDICVPIYMLYIFKTKHPINMHMFRELGGRRKHPLVFKAGLIDKLCRLGLSLCAIFEVIVLPLITERGSLLLAVDISRCLVASGTCWTLILYLQVIPKVDVGAIYIREMSSDLLSFVFVFTCSISLFVRHFMVFFSVNSAEGIL